MQKNSVIFLENVKISKDDVYNLLILPSNIFDESTKYNFYIWKFIHCHKQTVRYYLEDRNHSNFSQQLMMGTVSVSTTNSIAERNFGMLDRFIREKPNANMITYESLFMNEDQEWQTHFTPEKKSLMMKWARESDSKQYQDFKQRRIEITKAKNEKRLDKIEEGRKKESRTRLV